MSGVGLASKDCSVYGVTLGWTRFSGWVDLPHTFRSMKMGEGC
jgi:hypothetical protein